MEDNDGSEDMKALLEQEDGETQQNSQTFDVVPSLVLKRQTQEVDDEASNASNITFGFGLGSLLSHLHEPEQKRQRKDEETKTTTTFQTTLTKKEDRTINEEEETEIGIGSVFSDRVFATSLVTGKKVSIALKPTQQQNQSIEHLLEEEINNNSTSTTNKLSGTRIAEMFHELDSRREVDIFQSLEVCEDNNSYQTRELLFKRYAPTSYTDLVTDERLNRDLLSWLLSWKNNDTSISTPFLAKELERFGGKPAPVVLLTGLPGVGKSTLANVLMKQAGFEAIEINASDARTTSEFERLIMDTATLGISAGSAFNGGKLGALFVDEIDGIAGSEGRGAVDLLVGMIKATISQRKSGTRKQKKQKTAPKGKNDEETKSEEVGNEKEEEEDDDDDEETKTSHTSIKNRKRGKKDITKGDKIIRRPILCACNDLYAPALRELRKFALVFTVNKPTQQKFIAAMKNVCKSEGFNVDGSTLATLGDISGCDLRSALNTLEFASWDASRHKEKIITRDSILKSAVGEKDVEQSLFDIWRSIFFLQSLPNNRFKPTNPHNSSKTISTTTNEIVEFNELFRVINGSGAADKILDGCWTNYTRLGIPDHLLTKTIACSEWLSFCDCVNSGFGSMYDSISTAATLSFRSIGQASRMMYRRHDSVSILFPKAHSGMWKRRKELSSIATSFIEALPANTRNYINHCSIETEFLPFYLTIISPTLRPATNKQILPQQEKLVLSKVVSDMISCNLCFSTNGTSLDDADRYHLNPPINQLLQYGGQNLEDIFNETTPMKNREQKKPTAAFSINRRVLSVQNKKLISSEIEHENRRVEEEHRISASDPTKTGKQHAIIPPTSIIPKKMAKEETKIPQKRKDFFGRLVDCKPNVLQPRKGATTSQTIAKPTPLPPVRYVFHEGFTNAVRRKLFIKDLI